MASFDLSFLTSGIIICLVFYHFSNHMSLKFQMRSLQIGVTRAESREKKNFFIARPPHALISRCILIFICPIKG